MAAAVSALMDALHRLFGDVRPIDWLILAVDGLVLFVIVLFEGPNWWHEIAATRKASKLLPFLKAGEDLMSSAPYNSDKDHNQRVRDGQLWRENVQKWDRETQDFLTKLSPRALSAFRHVVHVVETDHAALTPSGQFFNPAQGKFGDAYQLLQARLDNIQKIMENAKAYF